MTVEPGFDFRQWKEIFLFFTAFSDSETHTIFCPVDNRDSLVPHMVLKHNDNFNFSFWNSVFSYTGCPRRKGQYSGRS
jgi:hypothetical protein